VSHADMIPHAWRASAADCADEPSMTPGPIHMQVYSQIGRTRTIPTATEDIARTRIAYFSCSQLVIPSIPYIQTEGLKPAVVLSGSSLCPHHSRVSDLSGIC
jgi:hypothetical protein